MFRDAQEELERLQAQLLEETQVVPTIEEKQEEEEYLLEDIIDEFLEDTAPGESPAVYQNFSNDYGRQLRNFATGYKAYNTDSTDTDLESFSEEVQNEEVPQKSGAWLGVVVALLAAIVGVIAYILGGLF